MHTSDSSLLDLERVHNLKHYRELSRKKTNRRLSTWLRFGIQQKAYNIKTFLSGGNMRNEEDRYTEKL